MKTPKISDHAAQRCRQMGISTKVPKYIVRHSSVVRPARTWTGRIMATCEKYPEFAVVYVEKDTGPVVVTIVWRLTEDYERSTDAASSADPC